MEFGRGQKEKGTDSLGERHGQRDIDRDSGRQARASGETHGQWERGAHSSSHISTDNRRESPKVGERH